MLKSRKVVEYGGVIVKHGEMLDNDSIASNLIIYRLKREAIRKVLTIGILMSLEAESMETKMFKNHLTLGNFW